MHIMHGKFQIGFDLFYTTVRYVYFATSQPTIFLPFFVISFQTYKFEILTFLHYYILLLHIIHYFIF